MLTQWFERGLGQIVAPDERAAAQHPPEGEGDGASFWQVVAPDPAYKASHGSPQSTAADNTNKKTSVPPADAFLSPQPAGKDEKVPCEHCHKWTPVRSANKANTPYAHTPTSTTATFASPPPNATELESLVLDAARKTASSDMSHQKEAETRNKVMRLCANSKPLDEKRRKRLETIIRKDSDLIYCRSSKHGEQVSDGRTPLMVAASSDNVPAIQVLLDAKPNSMNDQLNARDFQGRTAFHIAAETGSVNAIECLKKYASDYSSIGQGAPLDLMGRTPLGSAITSPHPSAKRNVARLTEQLFSPGDASVCGHKTPAKDRNHGVSELFLAYGVAEMPGMRVIMEDAICCELWSDDSAKALLGVCDGHGDKRLTSTYIVQHVAEVLRQTDEYPQHDFSSAFATAFAQLDNDLKQSKSNRGGGTTAVMALFTTGAIVVANVGDSRCILIQSKPENGSASTSLEGAMADLTMTEAKADADGKQDQDSSNVEETEESDDAGIVVTPMSQDHKPNLEDEKRRIEEAGLSVVGETFLEGDKEVTIHKVKLSDTERMAVSRTFGDYEYKANLNLSAEQQAVVPTPEIYVHTRDADRDKYLVLACDGVWDVMTNEEVADFVVTQVDKLCGELSPEEVLPHVGDLLCNECFARESGDNMSVVIVSLDKASQKIEGQRVGRTLDFHAE